MLLEIDGLRVLTDPVWGPRASPSRLAGPKRFQPVPVALARAAAARPGARLARPLRPPRLPDDPRAGAARRAVRHLARRRRAPRGLGRARRERITELDWWETHALPGAELTVTAAPSQHFSGRGLKDRNATLWSSFAIRSPRHAVFFSGDTGLTTEYAAIRERLGPFDLVMLEVGAFHPAWGDIHLGPENALEALALLGGGAFLPVHWGTFSLALHAWDEPAETLLELAPKHGAQLRDAAPRRAGRAGAVRGSTPWWRAVDAIELPAQQPAAEQRRRRCPRSMPWPID